MAISAKKIRQFKCPNCGGELQLQNARTKYVACPYCGTTADAGSDVFKILTKAEHPSKFPPRSFLKLGMVGEIYGKTYKIIGRTAWRSNYREYWAEDGETGYSSEVWTFDEWLLINEDGGYKTIIEDREGFSFSDTFFPTFPILPGEKTTIPDYTDGKTSQRIVEYGKSEILYFEGESTYLVVPGNTVGFSEYRNYVKSYLAEWRYDEQKVIKEIEFFEERKIPKTDVQKMFANDPEVAAKLKSENERRKVNRFNKRILVFTGLALFLYALFFNNSGYNFHNTFEEYFRPSESETVTPWMPLNDSTETMTVISRNNFPVTPEDKEIDMSASFTMQDSSHCLFKIFVLNDKGDTVLSQSKFAYDYIKGYKPDSVEYDYYRAFNQDAIYQGFVANFQKPENLRVGVTFEVPKKREKPDTLLSAYVGLYSHVQKKQSALAILLGLGMFAAGFFFKTKKV